MPCNCPGGRYSGPFGARPGGHHRAADVKGFAPTRDARVEGPFKGRHTRVAPRRQQLRDNSGLSGFMQFRAAVSYTHLTLPTICSV
eukprot:3197664-Alexandrium_andersonii.AAC.1